MTRQVKICGLKTPEAIDAALEGKADFIGLVFYEPSPRNVTIGQAKALARRARGKTRIVALTVDASDELLQEISNEVRPDYIQAHGSETPERIAEISARTGLPVIKAIKVREKADVDQAQAFADVADIILFDAKAPDNAANALPGGNGIFFDWGLLGSVDLPNGFMLSGGLDVNNIGEAARTTSATIFDVSSGVESAPGEKDIAAIKNFIVALHNAR